MHNKRFIILLIALLCSFSVFAQNAEQAAQSDTVSNEADSSSETESEIESSNAEVDPQVFKPSEEISEDAPVAFPVDI